MSAFIVTAAAAAAAGAAQVSGGVTAPERLTHHYEVQCGARTGSLVIEERFDRSVPSRTVSITGFRPLGAAAPSDAGPELASVSARMARIDRVQWLCDRRRLTIIVEYLDREAFDRAVRTDIPNPPGEPIGRVFLVLDEAGLRPEGEAAQALQSGAGGRRR